MTIDESADRRIDKRLRAKARRQGFSLHRNRSRTPEAWNYGGYMIVDERNCVVAGSTPDYCLTQDDVAAWLAES